MARMSPPQSGAVVDVRDQDVSRFEAAGWTKAGGETKKKSATDGSSSRKSSK